MLKERKAHSNAVKRKNQEWPRFKDKEQAKESNRRLLEAKAIVAERHHCESRKTGTPRVYNKTQRNRETESPAHKQKALPCP